MTLTDADVAQILDRAVATIDPMLDVLADSDPLSLKARTFAPASPRNCLDRTGLVAAGVLNVLDWPGTAGWDELPMRDRADWWVSRIGLITTGGVAFPSVFGAWTKKLPMSDYLGFGSQALVLRAVAREYGVTSREAGVAMLASILFDRDLDDLPASSGDSVEPLTSSGDGSFVVRLWSLGRTLLNLSRALGRRPGSPRLLGLLGWIPFVGGAASYLGEVIALRHAARLCREWIVAHPETVTPVASLDDQNA
ncbi:hypothetical protein [Gordonia neofelifaecis]|uniref:Uncharacterized protein n=1 Tax=Gordonia neofelifaecis NRRL B-59395 TaxID=644548 RepID=F1YKS7_9ACTN|nr:hypothetical protein [Gordonia neofelifaecis]EGD54721.1 hypothetical protein SCNU_12562 [Gordonia neofelifaecis NRRL B-59395]